MIFLSSRPQAVVPPPRSPSPASTPTATLPLLLTWPTPIPCRTTIHPCHLARRRTAAAAAASGAAENSPVQPVIPSGDEEVRALSSVLSLAHKKTLTLPNSLLLQVARSPERDFSGTPFVPVYVMLPVSDNIDLLACWNAVGFPFLFLIVVGLW